MPKAIVVYESKWGNTRRVAETIVEGLKEVPGTEPALSHFKQVDPARLADFDAIVIGSPNHIGTATWGIRRFINKLGRPELEGKLITFFDTCLPGQDSKAVRKMEERARKKAPRLEVASPGLSIRVDKMKGPISEGELSRCREFGNRIADQIRERH